MSYLMSFGCRPARKPNTAGGSRASDATSALDIGVNPCNFFKWFATVFGRHCETEIGLLAFGMNMTTAQS